MFQYMKDKYIIGTFRQQVLSAGIEIQSQVIFLQHFAVQECAILALKATITHPQGAYLALQACAHWIIFLTFIMFDYKFDLP